MNELLKLFESLSGYGADCLVLAVPVCALTALLKWKCPQRFKRLFTLVPFALGILVSGALEAVRAGGVSGLPWAELSASGIRCGGAATVYYVAYEQFFRRRRKLPDSPKLLALMGILEPYVPAAECKALARALADGMPAGTDTGTALTQIEDRLRTVLPDASERELLARLILDVLRTLPA